MRAAVLIALLAAGPALAQDPLVLFLKNDSDRMIRQLAIFPVGADGETVDNVLLARHEPVASNQTVALDTGLTRCGPISVWLQFADGEEVSAKTDLCRNNHLIAHD